MPATQTGEIKSFDRPALGQRLPSFDMEVRFRGLGYDLRSLTIAAGLAPGRACLQTVEIAGRGPGPADAWTLIQQYRADSVNVEQYERHNLRLT